MNFIANEIYHIYNRGNQKKPIFRYQDNYLYFLNKVKKYIAPYCNLFNWCLMPNHFHFLVHTTALSIYPVKRSILPTQNLIEGIRLLLGSYTKGINKQLGLTGNLFQQKTKAKCVSKVSDTLRSKDYSLTAFHYIHQNPLRVKLVARMEDWEFSSFRDYAGLRNGSLCNKQMALGYLDLDVSRFYTDSYAAIPEEWVEKIF